MMKQAELQSILDAIYNHDCRAENMAVIIRKIFQALDDSFYEFPPTQQQIAVLNQLENLADKVEEFFV